MTKSHKIQGQIVDIYRRTIYPGELIIADGLISRIIPLTDAPRVYIMPGFVDAHIHIESSMLVPYEFARVALTHGTVATVSDPHEIANVLGVAGVDYMIDSARDAGLKFHFGAPSCVPATSYETAGAVIDSEAVRQLLERDDIHYLAEMMNYPGVLHQDPEVIRKISHAIKIGKPIDGHAPGLRGMDARRYIDAGISTDHECYSYDEAAEKQKHGMKILIREGSAAKNYDALHRLIDECHRDLMYCSDDKHPDDLLEGHINELVLRSLRQGYDLYEVLRMACINPVEHYRMKVGTLRLDDPADFIVVEDLKTLRILDTYIDGVRVVTSGHCTLPDREVAIANNFNTETIASQDLSIQTTGNFRPVIRAIDGELITEKSKQIPTIQDAHFISDPDRDIMKVAVINRYEKRPPAIGFIENIGIKRGAFASSVAHDSHNIIAVGCDDESLAKAINLIIEHQGGLSVVDGDSSEVLPLPIAGLMSDRSCAEVGVAYQKLDNMVKSMGSQLRAPFMTLSFMALLVIPKIKMSDQGLFDAESFEFY